MIVLGRLLQSASERILDVQDIETGSRFEIVSSQKINLPVGSLVQVDIEPRGNYYTLNNIYIRAQEKRSSNIVLSEIFTNRQLNILLSHFYNESSILDMALNDWLQFEEEVRLYTKGIGPKTLEKAKRLLSELITPQEYEKSLSDYNFSQDEIIVINQFLKGRPFNLIEKEPYVLLQLGLPFDKVDLFAQKHCKVLKGNPKRLKGAILYVLDKAAQKGHLFLYQHKDMDGQLSLMDQVLLLVGNQQARAVREAVKSMIELNEVVHDRVVGEEVIYGVDYYNQEVKLARSIFQNLGVDRRYRRNKTKYENTAKRFIRRFERNNFKLDKFQKEAVFLCLQEQCSILTGPPGSGKTTIIELILSVYQELFPKHLIACAAPTGKAAERMSELLEPTGLKASTIHRLLKPQPWGGENNFYYNQNNPLPFDFLVFDEVSMISYALMQSILDAIRPGTKILLVGDEQQLSSIEPGSLLNEMLVAQNNQEEPIVPQTVLTEIFRQKEGSSLKERSISIRNEEGLSLNNSEDFAFYHLTDVDMIMDRVKQFAKNNMDKTPLKQWTILTPMNVHSLGVNAINQEVRDVVNPDTGTKPIIAVRSKEEGLRTFREGDKIIQLKNNNELGIVNGSVGQIRSIMAESVYVDFIDGEDWVELKYDDLKDTQLAYAMTVHKSQGSEYKNVLLVLAKEHEVMMNKQLVYTAVTRVKEHLTIIGDRKTITKAVALGSKIIQFSALSKRLNILAHQVNNTDTSY